MDASNNGKSGGGVVMKFAVSIFLTAAATYSAAAAVALYFGAPVWLVVFIGVCAGFDLTITPWYFAGRRGRNFRDLWRTVRKEKKND